ncbi:MAG TPA: polyphosphate kinase 2 family protein [Xanthobacteraceae bacterium]|jgi:PPK2 family polyphosphate:nucleotide phosphotransferase
MTDHESPALMKKFRINHPKQFPLASINPADTGGLNLDKQAADAMLARDIGRLAKLQERLYAQEQWALLVVLQGMDTAGKDSVIKHVMSGINPQGCEVHSFKAPSVEELAHDFLWRAAIRLPARGKIGIFNRSYYEEVVVVRVHPEMLTRQKLPAKLVGKDVWKERVEDIHAFERHLARNGIVILKFFLHISKEEQRRRLLARLDDPRKRWKFSMNDIAERKLWDEYMGAYEDAIRATNCGEAHWYVVPADHKWFARLIVGRAMLEALEDLHLNYPRIAFEQLRKVRSALETVGRGDHTRAMKWPPTTRRETYALRDKQSQAR